MIEDSGFCLKRPVRRSRFAQAEALLKWNAPQAIAVLKPPKAQRSAPEVLMPAIASLEDLKAAQKDLLEAKDLGELKATFKKWRRIGWKNVCKLWLQERTPEELKGERG
jgi:hypothetical protein